MEIFDRLWKDNGHQMQKIINGALKSTIDSHGDITRERMESAAKRIRSLIYGFINEELRRD
jgi:hypothetical protein